MKKKEIREESASVTDETATDKSGQPVQSVEENNQESISPKEEASSNEPKEQNVQQKETAIVIKISQSLKTKLIEKSQDEGISVDAFISELLAEGLASRLFELRRLGPPQHQGQHQGQQQRHHNNGQRSGSRNFQNNRGGRQQNSREKYFNIMDDKAAFIDYVRNMDKKR